MADIPNFIPRAAVTFETQEQNEEVIMLIREHLLKDISWIINTVFLLLILALANFFLHYIFNLKQIMFTDLFLLVICFCYAWVNFLIYYYSVGIITNRRIIDIDFYGILYREISEARLNKIEDITVKTGGYLGSLFNIGNVLVQTAGEHENIEFVNVSNPQRIVSIINYVIDKQHGP